MEDKTSPPERPSLENCHTNVFAITSIEQINWRCFTAEDSSDAILDSFVSCLEHNVLAAWKRTSATTRELWIFWFDKDLNAQVRIDSSFKVKSEGRYAASKTVHKRDLVNSTTSSNPFKPPPENDFSYQCRTQLFKAFHNLFERILLEKGLVRLGRWFVEPSSAAPAQTTNKQAFAFNFFVHGECWLCCTVDVRSRVPVFRCHSREQLKSLSQKVILAPYGLEVAISPKQPILLRSSQEAIKSLSLLKQFAKFYPIRNQSLADLVQVEIPADSRQCRMLYPLEYVLHLGGETTTTELFANYTCLGDRFCQNQLIRVMSKRPTAATPKLAEQLPTDQVDCDRRKRRAENCGGRTQQQQHSPSSEPIAAAENDIEHKKPRIDHQHHHQHQQQNPYDFLEIDQSAKGGVLQPPTQQSKETPKITAPPSSVKAPYCRMIASLESAILTPPDSAKQPAILQQQRTADHQPKKQHPQPKDQPIPLSSYNPQKGEILVWRSRRSRKPRKKTIIQPNPAVLSMMMKPTTTNNNKAEKPTMEVNGISLINRLSDSIVNIWRDVNYDTCTSCACVRKESTQVQESQLYLGNGQGKWACSCGFSAVVHAIRVNEYSNGLFEQESAVQPSAGQLNSEKIDLLRQQFSDPFVHFHSDPAVERFSPNNRVVDLGSIRTVLSPIYTNELEKSPFHWWTESGLKSCGSKHNKIVALIKRIRLILAEKLGVRRNVRSVDECFVGPLTWLQFHHLMNTRQKSRDDHHHNTSPPHALPIPHLQFRAKSASDNRRRRDYISASPFVLKVWETLDIEPFGGPRNVGYVVVALSDNANEVCSFVRNLSGKYERLKLGMHRGAQMVCPNACCSNHQQLANLHMTLKSPAIHPLDTRLYQRDRRVSAVGQQQSNDQQQQSIWLVIYFVVDRSESGRTGLWKAIEQFQQIPGVVAHLIYSDLTRSITLDQDHILRSQALSVYSRLGQDSYRYVDERSSSRRLRKTKRLINLPEDPLPPDPDYLPKSRLFQYNAPYIISEISLEPPLPSSSLLDPGSEASVLLRTVMRCQSNESTTVDRPCLFFAYCLSADKQSVLVSCSDERGEILETRVMNKSTKPVLRQQQQQTAGDRVWVYVRRTAISKIWQFVVEMAARLCRPIRLVITKIGILGYGELKSWACILSRRCLHRWASYLRGKCEICNDPKTGSLLHNHSPSFMSACLLSLELENAIRLFPESANSALSCTHIITYPTSALLQRQLNLAQDEHQSEYDWMFDVDLSDPNINHGLCAAGGGHGGPAREHEIELDQNASAAKLAFDYLVEHENEVRVDEQPVSVGLYISTVPPHGMPKWMLARNRFDDLDQSNTLKVTLHINVPFEPKAHELLTTTTTPSGTNQSKKSGGLVDQCVQCALASILNCSCSDSKNKLTEKLKTKPTQQTNTTTTQTTHPLDSSITHVPLKFVLESFHRLSWLTLNETQTDRHSCLPLPIDVLLKLYHAFQAATNS